MSVRGDVKLPIVGEGVSKRNFKTGDALVGSRDSPAGDADAIGELATFRGRSEHWCPLPYRVIVCKILLIVTYLVRPGRAAAIVWGIDNVGLKNKSDYERSQADYRQTWKKSPKTVAGIAEIRFLQKLPQSQAHFTHAPLLLQSNQDRNHPLTRFQGTQRLAND